jgi:hypothetical protein
LRVEWRWRLRWPPPSKREAVLGGARVHQLRHETFPKLAVKKCGKERDYRGKADEWCRSIFAGSVAITAREPNSKVHHVL